MVTRIRASACLQEVLERVLDKGLVIDAWVRVSVLGLDLGTGRARVVVASIDLCVDGIQPPHSGVPTGTGLPILREAVLRPKEDTHAPVGQEPAS